MRSLYNFILEPLNGKLYDNIEKIGDGELVTSSNIDNHLVTNRMAIVQAVPSSYKGPILDNALVIVHHNVFRKYYDMKGAEKHASGLIRGDIYMAEDIEIFMYKNDWSQDWTVVNEYCFVSPIANDNYLDVNSEKELFGIMEYPDKYLLDREIEAGDKVIFRTDSEYEFNIDGKKMYRVRSRDICMTQKMK